MANRLSADLVPLSELDGGEIAAWRELAGRALEPNPFFDPDFVLPAARGLGHWSDVCILAVRLGADWQACIPVHRRSGWHRVPLPALATWLHLYCPLGTPLVAPEEPEAAVAAAIGRMLDPLPRIGFAALEWVAADGPLWDAMSGVPGAAPLTFERFSRAALQRRPDPDYLADRIKGKHRREFRRLARMLGGELGGELTLTEHAGEERAIETFLALEASGWKGQNGTALACRPGHARFFRDMAANFALRGELELLFLESQGKVVAARCDLRSGDTNFCVKVAYDERFGRYSPGRELELRRIERFHADARLNRMDSCTAADNELFNRLWPDRRALATLAYPLAGALGKASASILRLAAAARNRRKRSLTS